MAKPHPDDDQHAQPIQGEADPGRSEPAPRPTVNMRKALAGLRVLQGEPIGKALVGAGYAPSTARAPKGKGLDALSCVKEAAKLDPSYSPAKILAEARRVMFKRLESLDPETTPAHQVARIVEVAEKFHGGADPERQDRETRTFVDRLEVLQRTIREVQRRGLLRGDVNGDSRDLEQGEVVDLEALGPDDDAGPEGTPPRAKEAE